MATNNDTRRRTAAEQAFWDRAYEIAYLDALSKNHRSEASRVNLAAARADGALEARRRSMQANGEQS
jgi:hypothetical protein